jgi:hypothetical protein
MKFSRPPSSEYLPYFDRYISLVHEADVVEVLERQAGAVRDSLAGLSEAKAGFRYAPGKWSVREVIGHLIDTERVFGYRALAVARGELASLPSFDENAYAALSRHDGCPLTGLVDEFTALRRSHVLLFRHMDDAAWERLGRVDGHPMSTRAAAYIMAGHARHHAMLFSARYGVPITA